MYNSDILGPVRASERILILDVLRGFALFGILLVNFDYFVHPFQTILFPLPENVMGVEKAIAWFIKFTAEGKFYTIFSILFAYGFTIIMSRAESRSDKFLLIISRRYLFLFLLGLFHAFLIWVGDILAMYGLLGFILILFRNAKPRTILIWIIIILIVPENNIGTLKKILIWGLIIGLVGNFVYATLILDIQRFIPTLNLFVASFFQMIGVPALSFFYISIISFMVIKQKSSIKYLAAPGRMALTTYMTQSIIFTFIVYGYGLVK